MGLRGAALLFLDDASIVALIDFIAILISAGIFLIQICIYFIFIVKIILNAYSQKLCFKLHWQEKSLLSNIAEPNFQKRKIKFVIL